MNAQGDTMMIAARRRRGLLPVVVSITSLSTCVAAFSVLVSAMVILTVVEVINFREFEFTIEQSTTLMMVTAKHRVNSYLTNALTLAERTQYALRATRGFVLPTEDPSRGDSFEVFLSKRKAWEEELKKTKRRMQRENKMKGDQRSTENSTNQLDGNEEDNEHDDVDDEDIARKLSDPLPQSIVGTNISQDGGGREFWWNKWQYAALAAMAKEVRFVGFSLADGSFVASFRSDVPERIRAKVRDVGKRIKERSVGSPHVASSFYSSSSSPSQKEEDKEMNEKEKEEGSAVLACEGFDLSLLRDTGGEGGENGNDNGNNTKYSTAGVNHGDKNDADDEEEQDEEGGGFGRRSDNIHHKKQHQSQAPHHHDLSPSSSTKVDNQKQFSSSSSSPPASSSCVANRKRKNAKGLAVTIILGKGISSKKDDGPTATNDTDRDQNREETQVGAGTAYFTKDAARIGFEIYRMNLSSSPNPSSPSPASSCFSTASCAYAAGGALRHYYHHNHPYSFFPTTTKTTTARAAGTAAGTGTSTGTSGNKDAAVVAVTMMKPFERVWSPLVMHPNSPNDNEYSTHLKLTFSIYNSSNFFLGVGTMHLQIQPLFYLARAVRLPTPSTRVYLFDERGHLVGSSLGQLPFSSVTVPATYALTQQDKERGCILLLTTDTDEKKTKNGDSLDQRDSTNGTSLSENEKVAPDSNGMLPTQHVDHHSQPSSPQRSFPLGAETETEPRWASLQCLVSVEDLTEENGNPDIREIYHQAPRDFRGARLLQAIPAVEGGEEEEEEESSKSRSAASTAAAAASAPTSESFPFVGVGNNNNDGGDVAGSNRIFRNNGRVGGGKLFGGLRRRYFVASRQLWESSVRWRVVLLVPWLDVMSSPIRVALIAALVTMLIVTITAILVAISFRVLLAPLERVVSAMKRGQYLRRDSEGDGRGGACNGVDDDSYTHEYDGDNKTNARIEKGAGVGGPRRRREILPKRTSMMSFKGEDRHRPARVGCLWSAAKLLPSSFSLFHKKRQHQHQQHYIRQYHASQRQQQKNNNISSTSFMYLTDVEAIQQAYWLVYDQLQILRGYIPEHVCDALLAATTERNGDPSFALATTTENGHSRRNGQQRMNKTEFDVNRSNIFMSSSSSSGRTTIEGDDPSVPWEDSRRQQHRSDPSCCFPSSSLSVSSSVSSSSSLSSNEQDDDHGSRVRRGSSSLSSRGEEDLYRRTHDALVKSLLPEEKEGGGGRRGRKEEDPASTRTDLGTRTPAPQSPVCSSQQRQGLQKRFFSAFSSLRQLVGPRSPPSPTPPPSPPPAASSSLSTATVVNQVATRGDGGERATVCGNGREKWVEEEVEVRRNLSHHEIPKDNTKEKDEEEEEGGACVGPPEKETLPSFSSSPSSSTSSHCSTRTNSPSCFPTEMQVENTKEERVLRLCDPKGTERAQTGTRDDGSASEGTLSKPNEDEKEAFASVVTVPPWCGGKSVGDVDAVEVSPASSSPSSAAVTSPPFSSSQNPRESKISNVSNNSSRGDAEEKKQCAPEDKSTTVLSELGIGLPLGFRLSEEGGGMGVVGMGHTLPPHRNMNLLRSEKDVVGDDYRLATQTMGVTTGDTTTATLTSMAVTEASVPFDSAALHHQRYDAGGPPLPTVVSRSSPDMYLFQPPPPIAVEMADNGTAVCPHHMSPFPLAAQVGGTYSHHNQQQQQPLSVFSEAAYFQYQALLQQQHQQQQQAHQQEQEHMLMLIMQQQQQQQLQWAESAEYQQHLLFVDHQQRQYHPQQQQQLQEEYNTCTGNYHNNNNNNSNNNNPNLLTCGRGNQQHIDSSQPVDLVVASARGATMTHEHQAYVGGDRRVLTSSVTLYRDPATTCRSANNVDVEALQAGGGESEEAGGAPPFSEKERAVTDWIRMMKSSAAGSEEQSSATDNNYVNSITDANTNTHTYMYTCANHDLSSGSTTAHATNDSEKTIAKSITTHSMLPSPRPPPSPSLISSSSSCYNHLSVSQHFSPHTARPPTLTPPLVGIASATNTKFSVQNCCDRKRSSEEDIKKKKVIEISSSTSFSCSSAISTQPTATTMQAQQKTAPTSGGLFLGFTDTNLIDRNASVVVFNIVGFHNYIAETLSSPKISRDYEIFTNFIFETARKWGGVLDTFFGDRFLISFNATTACKDHAVAAAMCALEVTKTINDEVTMQLRYALAEEREKVLAAELTREEELVLGGTNDLGKKQEQEEAEDKRRAEGVAKGLPLRAPFVVSPAPPAGAGNVRRRPPLARPPVKLASVAMHAHTRGAIGVHVGAAAGGGSVGACGGEGAGQTETRRNEGNEKSGKGRLDAEGQEDSQPHPSTPLPSNVPQQPSAPTTPSFSGVHGIGLRAGIATSRVVAGTLGTPRIKRYSIIGSCVPEACALVALAAQYPSVAVMMGGDMVPAVEGYVQYQVVDAVMLPGSGGLRRRIASVLGPMISVSVRKSKEREGKVGAGENLLGPSVSSAASSPSDSTLDVETTPSPKEAAQQQQAGVGDAPQLLPRVVHQTRSSQRTAVVNFPEQLLPLVVQTFAAKKTSSGGSTTAGIIGGKRRRRGDVSTSDTEEDEKGASPYTSLYIRGIPCRNPYNQINACFCAFLEGRNDDALALLLKLVDEVADSEMINAGLIGNDGPSSDSKTSTAVAAATNPISSAQHRRQPSTTKLIPRLSPAECGNITMIAGLVSSLLSVVDGRQYRNPIGDLFK